MSTIHRLAIELMTRESFAPFGEVWDPAERPTGERVLTRLDFECDGRTTVSTIWQPPAGFAFSDLERHFGVTQGFVQLSGAPAVVCAAPPTDIDDPRSIPRPEDVRAFLIDQTKGYSFNRGTWHSLNRYILAQPGATFLILNAGPNPTEMVDYATGQGTRHADLDGAPAPEHFQHDGDFGVSFEIVL